MTLWDSASRYDFDLGFNIITPYATCVLESGGPYYPVLEDVEKAAEQLTGFKVRGHRMGSVTEVPRVSKETKIVSD